MKLYPFNSLFFLLILSLISFSGFAKDQYDEPEIDYHFPRNNTVNFQGEEMEQSLQYKIAPPEDQETNSETSRTYAGEDADVDHTDLRSPGSVKEKKSKGLQRWHWSQ